ncbi:MAG: GAF domain-containing protein, partial [Dehalococcoidia bacterium]
MNLRWLKWLAIILPTLFLLLLELARQRYREPTFTLCPERLTAVGVMVVGVFIFSYAIFGLIARMQRKALQQSERLRVLNDLGIALAAELTLDALLQKVVDFSRDLVEARYGSLNVLESDKRAGHFFTSGLDPEVVARIGSPPKGLGLLGFILKEGRPLRLANIAQHPASVGFPPHHPPMKSFLGVPIVSKGTVIGILYLTDKEGGQDFTQTDQDAVAMLAAQAAVAIENARLYEQLQDFTTLQERERIAMDLHD